MAGPGDNAMLRSRGRPAADGRPARPSATASTPQAVEQLRGVRNHAARFGGSHAQRDLIDLTMIEGGLVGAATTAWSSALLAERANALPRGGRAAALSRAA